jgi:hypothetical protein
VKRAALWLLLAVGCVSAPEPLAPGTSAVYGRVDLAPREGVTPGVAGSGGYGDRRMNGVEFVDYSRPGFAVVFTTEGRPTAGSLALAIRISRFGTRIEPPQAAIGSSGRISIHNDTGDSHVVSYPAGDRVQPLAPGDRIEFDVAFAGEQPIFLLDTPNAETTIFGSPGPFSVVSATGLYAIENLEPGTREIRVWHPRFPPAYRQVELPAGERVEIDFSLGVGRNEHVHAH